VACEAFIDKAIVEDLLVAFGLDVGAPVVAVTVLINFIIFAAISACRIPHSSWHVFSVVHVVRLVIGRERPINQLMDFDFSQPTAKPPSPSRLLLPFVAFSLSGRQIRETFVCNNEKLSTSEELFSESYRDSMQRQRSMHTFRSSESSLMFQGSSSMLRGSYVGSRSLTMPLTFVVAAFMISIRFLMQKKSKGS
jgi:hypothetical protein